MPEVLIDVTRLLGRFMKGRLPTGVDRVSLAYIQHYGPSARAVIRFRGHSFALPKTESDKLFQWLLAPVKRLNVAILIAKSLLLGWNKQQVAGCFLFNTGHSGLEHDAYPALLRRQQVRPLFVVHDLIPITHPEYCRKGERERHVARMKNALAVASGVITNSQATLNELVIFAGSIGLPLPPSVVALLAPGMSGILPGERPMVAPYFVILGTIEPRKNHWFLLQMWRGLVERFGQQAPRLVVIGQRGWECDNVVDLLERDEQLKGFVIEHSLCSDTELVTYLHHAQGLLFPSFTEGYGMPLVEALALGVPVIASDLAVFREIAGEIPEYIDPLDGKRWSELATEYARPDSPVRNAQLTRIADFKVPTWTEHFAKVDALLEQLRCMAMSKTATIEAASASNRNFPVVIYACGFSIWKKPMVRNCFAGSRVVFVRSASQVPASSSLAVWGHKPIPGKLAAGVQLIHLEDGFLRSVGLGADLIRPVSWVIDTQGIYYDATQPSSLEVILQTTEFAPQLLERAARLRLRIVNTGLTKYNVGSKNWQRPAGAARVILVPGQVESDAALLLGVPGIRTNLGLLRAVRKANPDAYLLYKPHPDVVAGLRRKGQDEGYAERYCDEVVVDIIMGELLQQVDEVHTMTSLTGFEALLRGKKVVCYGQPFYASWGLTQDVFPVARRTRLLSLMELVAGTLILYPTYISRATGQLTTPEDALDELLAWRTDGNSGSFWWSNAYRFVVGKILRRL